MFKKKKMKLLTLDIILRIRLITLVIVDERDDVQEVVFVELLQAIC